MGWVYLDDHFPEHPKALEAGGPASWLYVCGLAYANRTGKGGLIPKSAVGRLTDARNEPALAKKLLAVELWHDVGDRYEIHDYADWNRSAIERSERARVAAAARWGKSPPDPPPIAGAMPEHPPGTANGHAISNAGAVQQQSGGSALAMPSPSPQSLVPSPQLLVTPVPKNSTRGEIGQNRDLVDENPGTNPDPDQPTDMLGRLVAVCVARKRDQVQLEALAVMGWAKTHVSDQIIDEAIGYLEQAAEPPAFPRAAANVIRTKAADHEITVPPFTAPTIGRSA